LTDQRDGSDNVGCQNSCGATDGDPDSGSVVSGGFGLLGGIVR